MKYLVEIHPNSNARFDAAIAYAQNALEDGKNPVLIVPSHLHQLSVKQKLAEADCGFAISVSTLHNWVKDLWGLFGDGSTFAQSHTRSVLLWKIQHASCIIPSMGMLDLLSNLAQTALTAIDTPADLSDCERDVIEILKEYRKELRERDLIEYSEAIVRLSMNPIMSTFVPIVMHTSGSQLSFAEGSFLRSCHAIMLEDSQNEPLPNEERHPELTEVQSLLYRRVPSDNPVAATGAVHVSLAAGPSASSRNVCDAIMQALEDGFTSILVADPNPHDLFEFCLPLLHERGISCGLIGNRSASLVDMGRALLLLGDLVEANKPNTSCAKPILAADFAINPFSGIEKKNAFRITQMHRANRLIDQDTILSDLASSAHDDLIGVINRIEEGKFTDAITLLRTYLFERFSTQPSYLAEQNHVLDLFEDLASEGEGLSFFSLAQIVTRSSVAVSVADNQDPQVLFSTQEHVATYEAGSVDCVVFSNMNAQILPVNSRENALSTLLEKLNAATDSDPLAQARYTFFSAFSAARRRVVVQRFLNDEKGDPAQAAIVFEELIDCYKHDTQTNQDIEKTIGIPLTLLSFASQAGEENVLLNNGAGNRSSIITESPRIGSISENAQKLISLPQRYKQGYFEGLDLSPSQIESYLECPYSWFAKRRLHLEKLDEEFGPAERGTFMHEVLRKFYQRFQGTVQEKVTFDTIQAAQEIMTQTFYEVCSEQQSERQGRRYVPITAWEEKERLSLLPKLLKYLDMEARLLPHFRPLEFEWQFAKNKPFPYAGCNLRGCIDRIDVDERGNAVIIDYKSSLGSDYRLHGKEEPGSSADFILPDKTQALMYAKVVQDILGLQVVACLYINPLKQEVLGSYDARTLGPTDIPFTKPIEAQYCKVPYAPIDTFDDLIVSCEREIKLRIARLALGEIKPNPLHPKACEYCPVNICEYRLEKI